MATRSQETRHIKTLQTAKSPATRLSAVKSLSELRTERAICALIDALGDEYEPVNTFINLGLHRVNCAVQLLARIEATRANFNPKELTWRDTHHICGLIELALNQQLHAVAVPWIQALYHHPMMVNEITKIILSYRSAGLATLLLSRIDSDDERQREAAIDAAFTLPPLEAHQQLKPHLNNPALSKKIFSRLLQRRPHVSEEQYRAHLRDGPWLDELIALERPAEFQLLLKLIFSLLPAHQVYPKLTAIFTRDFLADPAKHALSEALFIALFGDLTTKQKGAHIIEEPRWLTEYLTFALCHGDPKFKERSEVIRSLALSPVEFFHLMPLSLYANELPGHAGLLVALLQEKPWLCAAPNWDLFLQRLQKSLPEVGQIGERHPLASITANAESTPERLQEAARSPIVNIRRAVAQNPNTPLATLFALAKELPEEFLQNASLPLLHLEDAEFFIKFLQTQREQSAMRAILASPNVPPWFLAMLLSSNFAPEWKLRAIQHANTPQELIDEIAIDNKQYYEELKAHAVRRASQIPSDEIEELLTYAPSEVVRREAVKRPEAPRALLQDLWRLGASKDLSETRDVKNIERGLSPEFFARVAMHGEFVKRLILQHPDCPREQLVALSSDDWNRYLIAQHPSCPQELLLDFAKLAPSNDAWRDLHHGLLKNPNMSEEALRIIADHKYPWGSTIHAEVALHLNTPADVLTKLANEEALVRANVAKNPNTPDELLKSFVTDKDKGVRLSLIENQKLPRECFALLATDQNKEVRISVASSALTPGKVLLQMANNAKELREKNVLAQNENTPNEALQILLKNKSAELRRTIERNPNYCAE